MRALLVAFAACSHGVPAAIGADAAPDASDATDAADASAPPPPAATFRNPLNAGPDPFLTYHAGAYYLATTQGDAVRMWTAASLAELAVAPAITVWQDSDPSRNREVWAPSFYPFGGRWYLYYTADDGIDDDHRIYVAESDAADPLGPYHFKAELEPPGATGLWAIDPVVLSQATGLYLVWSGAGSEGHNLLYIAPMSDPWTISGSREYLPAAGGCPEVREAPAIVQHAGTTFLVYSTCDTGKPDYQLWMLTIPTASDPLDVASWTQVASPVFARDDTAGVWGPGSNAFFTSPDGTEDWIVYHAKNTSQYTYDARTTRAQKIAWVDGMPALGAPLAAAIAQALPSGDPGAGTYAIDDGSADFSAGWTAYPGCGVQCFLGGDHGSDQADATATFHFTGTQIALYSARDAGNGIAAFSIDGGDETTSDLYAPIRQGEQQVYVSPRMPPGAHDLRIRVTGDHDASSAGAAISVDRADVFTR